MELFILPVMIAIGAYLLKSRDQKRRIALLGSYLGRHQIEKLMESLIENYMRALGEADPARQVQIWNLSTTAELALCEQFNRFCTEFAKVDEDQARMSKLGIAIPYADKLFPHATFDLRKALGIHAHGITNAAHNQRGLPIKDKAFTLSAELFLMQHTCHWFCRSKTLASARMQARHKTSYAQLLQSVAPDTRKAYCSLIGV